MDLSALQALVPDLAGFLNLEPETVLFYMILIATICNIVARLIPDDRTGFLGAIRDVCKFFGVYVQNRITTGQTVTSVARSVLDQRVGTAVEDFGEQLEEELHAMPPIVQAFPGVQRDENGRFVKREPGSAI